MIKLNFILPLKEVNDVVCIIYIENKTYQNRS